MSEPLTSRMYIDGIYIPVGLLVVGTLIMKREWALYSVAIALVLGSWKFYRLRMSPLLLVSRASELELTSIPAAEPKKVLNPEVFQEFELKEKTVISHNVAM